MAHEGMAAVWRRNTRDVSGAKLMRKSAAALMTACCGARAFDSSAHRNEALRPGMGGARTTIIPRSQGRDPLAQNLSVVVNSKLLGFWKYAISAGVVTRSGLE